MGWATTTMGVSEARLLALQAKLQAGLDGNGGLNAHLQANPITATLIQMFGPVKTVNVDIGDIESTWNIQKDGCLMIGIVGAHRSGLNLTAERRHIGTIPAQDRTTSVLAIYHPQTFAIQDKSAGEWAIVRRQSRLRELALARLQDWLVDGCLNTVGGTLPLQSRVYQPDSDLTRKDALTLLLVTQAESGVFPIGPGTDQTGWGVLLTLTGTIRS